MTPRSSRPKPSAPARPGCEPIQREFTSAPHSLSFLLLVLLLGSAPLLPGLEIETNSLGMKLIRLPEGTYLRGTGDPRQLRLNHPNTIEQGADHQDERPAHPVQISHPFWIGSHEVTVDQFRRFVRETDHPTDAKAGGQGAYDLDPEARDEANRFQPNQGREWDNPGFDQSGDHPVTCVSWNDAVAFCAWLGSVENRVYRLPTEAEWEYAARAGTKSTYAGGDTPDSLYEFGNTADATFAKSFPRIAERQRVLSALKTDGYLHTSPVGRFKANAWGLYDMHGNVWEWCSNRYHDRYYEDLTRVAREKGTWSVPAPTVDPEGPDTTPQHRHGDWRSMRGGSWYTGPMSCRAASRAFAEAADSFIYTGFRVVRTLP